MKKILVFLLVAVFIAVTNASNKDHKTEWVDKNDRSCPITINVEQNDILIYSNKQFDNIQIQVTNNNGQVFFTNQIDLPAEDVLRISFFELPEGQYQVILSKSNQSVVWLITKQ